MLRPVSTLPLSKRKLSELGKSSFVYVEDVQNSKDWAHTLEQTLCAVPANVSALDLWQEELQQDKLTTLCEAFDNILDGGIQCGVITEISGAYGSGKTQICLQISVISQLPKECGGVNGQALYIDTRNGFSPSRVQDIVKGCQKRFPNVSISEIDMLKGIKISSPRTPDDLLSVIRTLKNYFRTNSEIRTVILDSLSLPVLCTFMDVSQRVQFYFRVIGELQNISANNNVAVIVVNELGPKIDAQGEIVYESAVGQVSAHRIHKRLVVARLNDFTFAAKILKASTMRQISIKFEINEDGIRDKPKEKNFPS